MTSGAQPERCLACHLTRIRWHPKTIEPWFARHYLVRYYQYLEMHEHEGEHPVADTQRRATAADRTMPPFTTQNVTSVKQKVTKYRNWVLITIALGVLLNPLNSSIISVAVARLQHVFHLTFADASWIISTYYLASAISQPVMGKVADRIGRKRMFLLGLGLAALSSAVAPFAPTFAWLIALRLIQSVGSGAIYPAGMAIVRHWITQRQASALAFLAVFSSGAAAFGPSIGGFLINWGDWQSIFFVNFPFIIVSFVLGAWLLPADRFDTITHPVPVPDSAEVSETTPADPTGVNGPRGNSGTQLIASFLHDLDLPGIGAFAAAVVLMLVFLLSVSGQPIWWTGGVGVIVLAFFLWRELNTSKPFINLRVFRTNIAFTWVEIQFITVNLIFYSIFFGIPEYLQQGRGLSSQTTGLVMLCLAGSSLLVTPITGRWVERSGSRPPLFLAGLCLTVGSVLFLTWGPHTSLFWVAAVLFILGLSNGLNNIGLQTALFAAVPQNVIATASGLFMTARYLGTILSTVLLGFLFRGSIRLGEVHHLAVALAILGLLVIAMCLRLPKGPHKAQED